jgi:hypothetical protein
MSLAELVLAHRQWADPTRLKAIRCPPSASIVQGSISIQEAEMEATRSQTGFRAIEYVLVAAPTTLLLSVYLFGSLVIGDPFGAPKACRLNAQPEYAAPRG